MSEILQLSTKILSSKVMKFDKSLACIRAKGYAEPKDIYVTEIDPDEQGLGFYSELFEFIRNGYTTTISNPAGIATLGIISRKNLVGIVYEPAAYSGIKGRGSLEASQSYSLNMVFQLTTVNIIKSLANEIEVQVDW